GLRRRPLLGDPAQHLDAGEEVEAAVEPAAVRDRVDVAADQQLSIRGTRQGEPLVSGLVDLLLDGDAVEPAAEPLPRRRPRVGPGNPLGTVLVAGQLLELTQLRDGAGGLERHRSALGERGCALELDADERLVTEHPGTVTGGDRVRGIAEVLGLAAVGAHDGPDALRPAPAGLEREPADLGSADR